MKKNRAVTIPVVVIMIICMTFSLIPLGGWSYAYADEHETAEETFNNIVGGMEKTPTNFSNSEDPYGYGVNNPFTLSPANELVIYGSPAPGSSLEEFNSYDGLKYRADTGYDFLGSATVNKKYETYTDYPYGQDGPYTKQYVNAPQMIAFDPFGT